ncbi:MAG: ribonuclease HII [bacterium]
MTPDLSIERRLLNEGYRYIAGVDECGRGCLAGPVLACSALIYIPEHLKDPIVGIDDSKKLSTEKREKLFHIIKERAIDICFGISSPDEIVKFNILTASLNAMSRAIYGLKREPDIVIVDGIYKPESRYKTINIIKGDSRCYVVAIASIMGKVMRDRIMASLASRYPQYGWNHNKGYSTKKHKDAIQQYGITSQHRITFKPVRYVKEFTKYENLVINMEINQEGRVENRISDNDYKKSKNRKIIGDFGEKVVCEFLKSKGAEVLERNYRNQSGEIDIIATDGEYLIICEVKTVSEKSGREQLEYIDECQWERIKELAELYMAEKVGREMPIRYDLAIVKIIKSGSPEIQYIESFYTIDD